jgi:hypothetical protein
MKPKMTLCLAMILIEVGAAAQGVRSDDAIAAFRKLDASVEWNVASAEIADVGCDGKPDTVMLGYKKDEVAVGIVFAAPEKAQLFTFPIQADASFGFCLKPERIEVSPIICEFSDGTVLSGCKATDGCKAFSIANNGCDPFYFYWNSSIGVVSSWQQRK